MQSIRLNTGQYALIDDVDLLRIISRKWYLCKDRHTQYALAYNGYKKPTISMHRFILNPPIDKEVDHINGNGLDNRRENLRLCTRSENCINKRVFTNKSSKYKGVHLRKEKTARPWQAYIKENQKVKHLGFFETENEAALAYNQAALQLFGEFCKPNLIS